MRDINEAEARFGTKGRRFRMVNRTGGTSLVGGVYGIDISQAQGESTTIGLGVQGMVAMATAIFCQPWVVCLEAVADNAVCEVAIPEEGGSILDILVLTTAIAKGDQLKKVNAQAYLAEGTPATDPFCAIALEASTAGTADLIKCLCWPTNRPAQAVS